MTAAPELTERQAEVHRFMLDHQRKNGRPATVRAVGAALGIKSPNGVIQHFKAMLKKGYVKAADRGAQRCFTAVDPTKPDACPCCGREMESTA